MRDVANDANVLHTSPVASSAWACRRKPIDITNNKFREMRSHRESPVGWIIFDEEVSTFSKKVGRRVKRGYHDAILLGTGYILCPQSTRPPCLS